MALLPNLAKMRADMNAARTPRAVPAYELTNHPLPVTDASTYLKTTAAGTTLMTSPALALCTSYSAPIATLVDLEAMKIVAAAMSLPPPTAETLPGYQAGVALCVLSTFVKAGGQKDSVASWSSEHPQFARSASTTTCWSSLMERLPSAQKILIVERLQSAFGHASTNLRLASRRLTCRGFTAFGTVADAIHQTRASHRSDAIRILSGWPAEWRVVTTMFTVEASTLVYGFYTGIPQEFGSARYAHVARAALAMMGKKRLGEYSGGWTRTVLSAEVIVAIEAIQPYVGTTWSPGLDADDNGLQAIEFTRQVIAEAQDKDMTPAEDDN
jgi:hypothetical protein